MTTKTRHLGSGHPLAAAARALHVQHQVPKRGTWACGACWELAIRADERLRTEERLAAEPVIDRDRLARHLAGDRQRLTEPEQIEVVRHYLGLYPDLTLGQLAAMCRWPRDVVGELAQKADDEAPEEVGPFAQAL